MMPKNDKKKFRLPHWLPFVASLLGVGALMVLYVLFVANVLGGQDSMNDGTPAYVQPDYAPGAVCIMYGGN